MLNEVNNRAFGRRDFAAQREAGGYNAAPIARVQSADEGLDRSRVISCTRTSEVLMCPGGNRQLRWIRGGCNRKLHNLCNSRPTFLMNILDRSENNVCLYLDNFENWYREINCCLVLQVWRFSEKKKIRISLVFSMGFFTPDKLKCELLETWIYFHRETHGAAFTRKNCEGRSGKDSRVGNAPDGYFGCPEIKSKKNWPSARSCYASKSGQLIMKRAI